MYLNESLSAGEGCEAAVTAVRRCEFVKFWKCDEFVHWKQFPLKQKSAVYNNYVRLAIPYRCEALYSKQSQMRKLWRTERSIVIAICRVQQYDGKRSRDLTLMLDLNETVDQLAYGKQYLLVHSTPHLLKCGVEVKARLTDEDVLKLVVEGMLRVKYLSSNKSFC